jgi:large subunit ribosomal protein L13
MKTYVAKPQTVERDWCLVDATDKTLGRLAAELASRLRGKHKAEFTPHVDTGDNIIVINAEKIRVTGNKLKDKMYYRHTGYIGNLKSINLEKQLDQHPERNPLGRAMFRKLHVYAGPEHPHAAQQPIELDI